MTLIYLNTLKEYGVFGTYYQVICGGKENDNNFKNSIMTPIA